MRHKSGDDQVDIGMFDREAKIEAKRLPPKKGRPPSGNVKLPRYASFNKMNPSVASATSVLTGNSADDVSSQKN